MRSSINYLDASGIYTCSCGNLETHIHGNHKAPCSKCDKNNEWSLILKTEELEAVLKNNKWYDDLIKNLKKRYTDK